MKLEKEIRDISEKIYQVSRQSRGFFRTQKWIVELFSIQVQHFNIVDFILWQLKTYPRRYCLDLFLCLSDKWKTLTSPDFHKIIESMEHPTLGFSFIEFVFIYLKIDSLELITNSRLSTLDKYIYIEYYTSFPGKLIPGNNNSFLEEEMGVDLMELEKIGNRLVKTDSTFRKVNDDFSRTERFLKKNYLMLKYRIFFTRI